MFKLLRALLAVSLLCVPASAGFLNIGGNGRVTVSAGGEFQEGNPAHQLLRDSFDYVVARGSANNTTDRDAKIAAYVTAGPFAEVSDSTLNGNKSGFFWNVTASEAASQLGYSGGAFPGSVDRALVMQSIASAGPDQNGLDTWRISDIELRVANVPANIWIKRWIYYTADSIPYVGNKDLYWLRKGTDNGYFLINNGWRNTEHQNVLHTSGERSAFEAGTVPHARWYWEMRAAGYGSGPFTGLGELVNNNMTEAPSDTLAQNIAQDNFIVPGEWVEQTLHVDTSGAQGEYHMWLRRYGESRVEIAGFVGGVTSGITWPIDSALRTLEQDVIFPSVVNWLAEYFGIDTSDECDVTVLVQDLVFATQADGLWTAADDPDPPLAFRHDAHEQLDWLARICIPGIAGCPAANDFDFRLRASR